MSVFDPVACVQAHIAFGYDPYVSIASDGRKWIGRNVYDCRPDVDPPALPQTDDEWKAYGDALEAMGRVLDSRQPSPDEAA